MQVKWKKKALRKWEKMTLEEKLTYDLTDQIIVNREYRGSWTVMLLHSRVGSHSDKIHAMGTVEKLEDIYDNFQQMLMALAKRHFMRVQKELAIQKVKWSVPDQEVNLEKVAA